MRSFIYQRCVWQPMALNGRRWQPCVAPCRSSWLMAHASLTYAIGDGRTARPLEPPDELLHLLHVVPTYLPAVRYGGPIRSVHALCRGLAELGHEVHVFTTSVDGRGDSAVPLGTPVALEGVQVPYSPSRFLRRLYWSPPMRRALSA